MAELPDIQASALLSIRLRGFSIHFVHRDATDADLPRIVEIYNFAVATRESSCDLEPTTVAARRESFSKHTPGHRPIWVVEVDVDKDKGVVGYLGFFHFMNERPGYFIPSDGARVGR